MKIIAHRGASLECPENTLAAFARAMEIGVDAVETDLQQTADGQVVLFHDTQVRGAGGRSVPVAGLTYAALQETVPQGKNIPVLEELFDLTAGKVPLCLELKQQGLVPGVLASLRGRGLEETTHLTSFLSAEILEVRRRAPSLSVSVTFSEWPEKEFEALKREGIFEISLAQGVLTARRAAWLKEAGFRLRVYTVNDPSEAMRLETWGVDAIFTDDPRAMRSFRARA